METLVVIPARGGSRGVPRKNLRAVGGRSLIERAVNCALSAKIGSVFVSSDDDEILAVAVRVGAFAIRRPAELATDEATSESVLLHALDVCGGRPSIVCMMQCTSPFTIGADLRAGLTLVMNGADCVFSACSSHDFLWTQDGEHCWLGVNHDPRTRLRRQDRAIEVRENGALYFMRAAGLRTYRHRYFGRVACLKMPRARSVEIDSEEDFMIAEALASWGQLPP